MARPMERLRGEPDVPCPRRPKAGRDMVGSRSGSLFPKVLIWTARRFQALWDRPDFVTDLLQILKTVIAGTAAWWFAITVLESPLPFLAPWTALLTVHATVHRSFSHGVQTTLASAIGWRSRSSSGTTWA